MLNISLVIINDNTEEYLNNLFTSIQEQIPLEIIEIIFIDNCSKDKSVQIAKDFGIKKIYCFDEIKQVRGTLYNKGYELSKGEYIIFAHSDIYFASDFFQKLCQSLGDNSQFDFVNFSQYYADRNFFGNNQIAIDYDNKELFYRQLFQNLPEGMEVFLECSEACFMVNRRQFEHFNFNGNYQNSFFEYELLNKIVANGGKNAIFTECKFTHYFIEAA